MDLKKTIVYDFTSVRHETKHITAHYTEDYDKNKKFRFIKFIKIRYYTDLKTLLLFQNNIL